MQYTISPETDLKNKELTRAYKALGDFLTTQYGQMVKADLERFAFLYEDAFLSEDVNKMVYNQGRRSVMLRIINQINKE